jgi:hypothetical protein
MLIIGNAAFVEHVLPSIGVIIVAAAAVLGFWLNQQSWVCRTCDITAAAPVESKALRTAMVMALFKLLVVATIVM